MTGAVMDTLMQPTRRRAGAVIGLAGALCAVHVVALGAQCTPPANSNEARLLAFYEAPIVFSTADAPMRMAPGSVALTAELTGVPAPAANAQQTNFCYAAKQDATHLSPLLPRLRITVGLPLSFAVEGAYLPPVTVDRAQPNLGSLALSYTRSLLAPVDHESGVSLTMQLRAHATMGSVKGPITCPSSALQTTNEAAPCWGTIPSDDAFYATSEGGEGTLAITAPGGRVTAFAGAGYTALAPHFRVGFTDEDDVTDRTLVEVDLQRGAVFGGVDVQIIRALDAGAEVYSVPADVTTWRVTARYRLW
jgi:hypothetical protein